MKVAVIGCTHAGTAAVLNIVKEYPEAEVTVYEKNNNISFLSCGIALYVGGTVKNAEELFYSSPEQLAEKGVKMNMRHEVLNIDTAAKKLTAKNISTGEVKQDSYDKLILTTGSWPVIPPLEGINLNNVELCKNYDHAKKIIEKAKNAENITVIGAGYIGIELVEAFSEAGKNVTLVDSSDRILNKYLDEEFTGKIEGELNNKGVKLALNEMVTHFSGSEGNVQAVHTSECEHAADLVILCVGFRPNTCLVKGQVDMLSNGAIIVNEYMETSVKDVFAAGDSCAVIYNPSHSHEYIPLATNAVRMGTLAAKNLKQKRVKYRGTQGTSGLKLYDLNISSTGMTETAALAAEMNVKSITINDQYRPGFMPENEDVLLKVVYEEESGRIVGAQIMSKADLTQCMNTLSVCIQNEMTMEDLGYVDFFFQPHYNKPWHFLNQAGLQAAE
ncbi:FAD-dependent oxidoreductase [Fictibacillus aquaticus]|uniref:NADH oxidase n=1 Tax=Fictibacillus aquaticus TaxID=2021314 RepID=A0A235FFV8_9BACL|nr:FAD-dependent oxidoreductase [Fictibacillus aquaticus]OYD59615.1 NADH oxidase [Fictibacillus aquaticus]